MPYDKDLEAILTDEDTRWARDPETGEAYEVPMSMTYEEWKKKQQEKSGIDSVEIARKKLYNRAADIKQMEKYQARLGKKNVPQTLDAFQKIKYNHVEQWADLKYYYKNIDDRPLYCVRIDRELQKAGYQFPASLPSERIRAPILPDVGSKTQYHIMQRMMERNITDDEVQLYIDSASVYFPQVKGTRRMYVSESGVTVAKQTSAYPGTDWIAKTTYRKEDFDDLILLIIKAAEK